MDCLQFGACLAGTRGSLLFGVKLGDWIQNDVTRGCPGAGANLPMVLEPVLILAVSGIPAANHHSSLKGRRLQGVCRPVDMTFPPLPAAEGGHEAVVKAADRAGPCRRPSFPYLTPTLKPLVSIISKGSFGCTSIFKMEAPYLTEMELKYEYEVVVR